MATLSGSAMLIIIITMMYTIIISFLDSVYLQY